MHDQRLWSAYCCCCCLFGFFFSKFRRGSYVSEKKKTIGYHFVRQRIFRSILISLVMVFAFTLSRIAHSSISASTSTVLVQPKSTSAFVNSQLTINGVVDADWQTGINKNRLNEHRKQATLHHKRGVKRRRKHPKNNYLAIISSTQSPVQPLLHANVCPFQQTSGYETCDNANKNRKPCLVRLRGLPMEQRGTDSQHDVIDKLVPPHVWRHLAKIPGDSMDPVHLTLIPFFTSIQWRYGVYGTVGEIGDVGYGKFTSLLARIVDQNSGERLFIADTFSDPMSPSAAADVASFAASRHPQRKLHMRSAGKPPQAPNRHDVFAINVRDSTGFEEMASEPGRRLSLYRGNLLDLVRNLTLVVGPLPSFRIIAIGNHFSQSSSSPSSDSLLLAMEVALCIMSDGGIVVLNGTPAMLTPTVEAYTSRNGRGSLTPILYAGNKLYLTTAQFRRKYYEVVVEAMDLLAVRLGMDTVKMVENNLAGFEILSL